jgi:hypothetical protein
MDLTRFAAAGPSWTGGSTCCSDTRTPRSL